MRNLKLIVVLVACVAGLTLTWTPLQIGEEPNRVILGGYVWLAKGESRNVFMVISIVFTVVFTTLPLLYYALARQVPARRAPMLLQDVLMREEADRAG